MSDSLSGQVHKELEDRFILKALPKDVDGIKPVVIRQGVLREVKKDNNVIAYARIRAYEEPGKAIKYSLGVKHFPLSQESETNISREMFDAFYPNHLDKPQEKKRYILDKGWIIDKKKDGEIVAERERKSGQEKSKLPDDWVGMKKEATVWDAEAYTRMANRLRKAKVVGAYSKESLRHKDVKQVESALSGYKKFEQQPMSYEVGKSDVLQRKMIRNAIENTQRLTRIGKWKNNKFIRGEKITGPVATPITHEYDKPHPTLIEQKIKNFLFGNSELNKLSFIKTYDARFCKLSKPIVSIKGSADLPIIVKRDYADEMGGAISSGGSPMSTGG